VEAFAEDWLFASGEALSGLAWFPRPAPLASSGMTARAVTSGPDADLEKLEFIRLAAIASARRSVRVATPYFLPDERLCSALELAALRGVAVDLVIPERSNRRLVDWAARAQARPLLAAGCRVWRAAAPFTHSKLMTVDGAWSLVGSANWDLRSLRLNFELDVEVYDEGLAVRIEDRILERAGQPLTTAELDNRRLPITLRDAAARLLLPYL
jgi:cardiolipin synthase